MRDPIRQLRELPWAETFACSGITLLLVMALEALILFGITRSEPVLALIALLTQGGFGFVVSLVLAVLIGMAAVVVLQRLCPWVRIYAGVLWALVGSLMLLLIVRWLLQGVIPMLLLSASVDCLLGMAIGIFWKGRPYW